MLKDKQGWRRARLTKHTARYNNSAYKLGYYVTLADPAHKGDVDEHWAFFEPGKDRGVLRGVDTAFNLSKVQFQLPDGPRIDHTVSSTYLDYDEGEFKVFKEEVEYLRGNLPFKCTNGRWITDFQPEKL